MKSIKTIFKVGNGPSSSHTVGVSIAARHFKKHCPDADSYVVTLFGSLADTGRGHGTAKAIHAVIPDAKIVFDVNTKDLPHPNTMCYQAFCQGKLVCESTIMSIGGGSIRIVGEKSNEDCEIYPQKNFTEMLNFCDEKNYSLADYVFEMEDKGLYAYLEKIWNEMQTCVQRGLASEGALPGGLNIVRKAKSLFENRCHNESSDITTDRKIAAYAFAVSEENASENVVVTAPTCGSCGVIPAIFYYMKYDKGFTDEEIIRSLAVAALVGNVIQTNASISGAECGCQAEIGSACSMAAAGLACLYDMNNNQIEYAAEVAMEHHLGLTCDPVGGLVQIPCIERNAVAAMRAMNAVNLSRFMYQTRKISFDQVVETMYVTGKDLDAKYRETSHGGLAVMYECEE